MALGPRLDLRQTQTLVMTPQLRQAIKLLQYSNVEVASFVEEELERNPLLERDEAPSCRTPSAPRRTRCRNAISEAADAAQFAQADTLPRETAAPLDADPGETYDAGGVGRRWRRRPRRSPAAAARATSRSTTAASTTSPMSGARCATISASSCGCRSPIRWTA